MREEKEEKEIQTMEKNLTRAERKVKGNSTEPKRTWFQTPAEKKKERCKNLRLITCQFNLRIESNNFLGNYSIDFYVLISVALKLGNPKGKRKKGVKPTVSVFFE